ncbi:hypothetical protein ACHHYP_12144 [Achlya hypogyna]|uniref:Uncharacterized protein n=1 Tax=Achlya hypogyna TaxID=1202772 RepID=A0A1V9ZH90_ACHHY|nr:hypothetical protein ACHHYP_12144 [Achlya hypogyna]
MAELRDAYKAIKLLQDAVTKSKAETVAIRGHFQAQLADAQNEIQVLQEELRKKPSDAPCQHHGLGLEAAERQRAIEVQALRDEIAHARQYREENEAALTLCQAALAHARAQLVEKQVQHEAEVLGLQQTNAIVLLEKHVLVDEVGTLRAAVAEAKAALVAAEGRTQVLLLQQHSLQTTSKTCMQSVAMLKQDYSNLKNDVERMTHDFKLLLMQLHRASTTRDDASDTTAEATDGEEDSHEVLYKWVAEKKHLQHDLEQLQRYVHDNVQRFLETAKADLQQDHSQFQQSKLQPLKTIASDLSARAEALQADKDICSSGLRSLRRQVQGLRTDWHALRDVCVNQLKALDARQRSDAACLNARIATVGPRPMNVSGTSAPTAITVSATDCSWAAVTSTVQTIVKPFQRYVQCLQQLQGLVKTMASNTQAIEDWTDGATQELILDVLRIVQTLLRATDTTEISRTISTCHHAVHDQLYSWHDYVCGPIEAVPVFGIHSPEVDHIVRSWSPSVAEQEAAKLWLSCVATGDIDGSTETSHFRFRRLSDEVKDAFLVLLVPVLQRTQGPHLHVRVKRHPPSTASDDARWDLLLEVGDARQSLLSLESDDTPKETQASPLYLAIQRRLADLQRHS